MFSQVHMFPVCEVPFRGGSLILRVYPWHFLAAWLSHGRKQNSRAVLAFSLISQRQSHFPGCLHSPGIHSLAVQRYTPAPVPRVMNRLLGSLCRLSPSSLCPPLVLSTLRMTRTWGRFIFMCLKQSQGWGKVLPFAFVRSCFPQLFTTRSMGVNKHNKPFWCRVYVIAIHAICLHANLN